MSFQTSFELPVQLPSNAYAYGIRSDGGVHGVVLTKPHVVELMLDLAGYTSNVDLSTMVLLEPSCGEGAFLIPAIERLLRSAQIHGHKPSDLGSAIVAFDIDDIHVEQARSSIVEVLKRNAVEPRVARRLAEQWVRPGDFLLAALKQQFNFVVGNPPYIRIEQLAPELQAEYRARYSTLFDRSDIYVAFIERSLSLLSEGGVLSFICADRWTLNRYGAPLRALVTSSFDVLTYIDLHKASPFETEVIAYPSIFVIARGMAGRPVQVIKLSEASSEECATVRKQIRGLVGTGEDLTSNHYPLWFSGDDPWVLSSPHQLAALRQLEARLPLLEDGGKTAVRIGVASGNDSIYIVSADADIEKDRLVPLVMREDIDCGVVRDSRRCIINTFDSNGTIKLSDYPRLNKYLMVHEAAIRRRHVARSNGDAWFRTIDRVYPALVSTPKLLIPDIAGSNEVVFESGHFYPHHNLYFVISDVWDMEVLGGLLSSRVALFFVWSYAVKMRGGYLRFQAQYLRRIRIPQPASIPSALRQRIKAAFRKRDFEALDELARIAYGLESIPEFAFVDTRK